MTTPTPPDDLPGYDTLGWPRDALAVWIEADDSERQTVRDTLPELGAALDRQAEWVKNPPERRRPRWLRDPDQPQRPVPWQERDEGSDR